MKAFKAILSGTVLLAAIILTGCGKSSSGSTNSVVGTYGYGNCATCAGYGQLLVQATSTDQLGEALTLQFYTQTAVSQPGYGTTYTGSNNSTYQVAAQGVLYITQSTALSCGLPPGQYTVSSAQPSVMYGSAVQQLALIGSGPNQVQLALNVYFLSPTSMQVRGAMQGAGGQACQLVMN